MKTLSKWQRARAMASDVAYNVWDLKDHLETMGDEVSDLRLEVVRLAEWALTLKRHIDECSDRGDV